MLLIERPNETSQLTLLQCPFPSIPLLSFPSLRNPSHRILLPVLLDLFQSPLAEPHALIHHVPAHPPRPQHHAFSPHHLLRPHPPSSPDLLFLVVAASWRRATVPSRGRVAAAAARCAPGDAVRGEGVCGGGDLATRAGARRRGRAEGGVMRSSVRRVEICLFVRGGRRADCVRAAVPEVARGWKDIVGRDYVTPSGGGVAFIFVRVPSWLWGGRCGRRWTTILVLVIG
jgi:hypothetical protein